MKVNLSNPNLEELSFAYNRNSNNREEVNPPDVPLQHWSQFEPAPHLLHLAIGMFMTFISIVAITGNSIVIGIFVR